MDNMIAIFTVALGLAKRATQAVLCAPIKTYLGVFRLLEVSHGGKGGDSMVRFLYTTPLFRFGCGKMPTFSENRKRNGSPIMQMIILGLICLCQLGCMDQQQRGKLLPHTETVLQSGDTIVVNHPHGSLTIQAGAGASRSFRGTGWKADHLLIPRKSRWDGSAGLYDPASSTTPYGRVLADEGRQFFSTESEALRFLNMGSEIFRPVYTNQGLVVGYSVSPVPGGEVRSIRIWQIYIEEKKPALLRGAKDSLFGLAGRFAPDEARPANVRVGLERRLAAEEYRAE